jgi:hypothetical protein
MIEISGAPIARDFIFLNCQIRHDWRSIGGRNCGCADGSCSVPVMECYVCGQCDYGVNAEADEVLRDCGERDA